MLKQTGLDSAGVQFRLTEDVSGSLLSLLRRQTAVSDENCHDASIAGDDYGRKGGICAYHRQAHAGTVRSEAAFTEDYNVPDILYMMTRLGAACGAPSLVMGGLLRGAGRQVPHCCRTSAEKTPAHSGDGGLDHNVSRHRLRIGSMCKMG